MSRSRQTTHPLLSLVAALAVSTAAAQNTTPPTQYAVGVRDLGNRKEEPGEATQNPSPAMPPQDGTQPTLPGGKLPQYQLDLPGPGQTADEASVIAARNDPRLRFLLVLPDQPLLIEAALTIDGQPFQMSREKRIQSLLEQLQRELESAIDTAVANAKSGAASPTDAATDTATDSTVESSPAGADDPADAAEPDPAEPSVTPPSVPAYTLPSTVLDRLRRQVALTGESVSGPELRWLLTHWIDGPTLLLLRDHFQRFRANQRPVFQILDRNGDRRVSADELQQAVASFEACDLNRNDIVDYSELERSAEDPRRKLIRYSGAGRLIFLLPDASSAAAIYARLAAACASTTDVSSASPKVPRFDSDGNGSFDEEELAVLRESTPDLRVTVAFDSEVPEKSRLTVALPPADSDVQWSPVEIQDGTATETVIRLRIGGMPVEFSAVQDGASDQVSLGAVNDGYPLLGEIDPNDDGRFTIRERRTLVKQLRKFDRDQDGTITERETQATVRVCFGLGATVHRELSGLRRIDRQSRPPVTSGPDWFVRMDRNKDNDLTRKEFPGTDEQFTKLDADGDQLVSAEEARNASP